MADFQARSRSDIFDLKLAASKLTKSCSHASTCGSIMFYCTKCPIFWKLVLKFGKSHQILAKHTKVWKTVNFKKTVKLNFSTLKNYLSRSLPNLDSQGSRDESIMFSYPKSPIFWELVTEVWKSHQILAQIMGM